MLCLILKLNLTFKKLKLATINYVTKCLELQFKKKFKRKNFLFSYKNEIYNLSNVTPNGVVRPKREHKRVF